MKSPNVKHLWRQLHNLEQVVREKAYLRPRDCQCQLCEPGNYFECPKCGHLRPWCFGAADDYPELCNSCWVEVHNMEYEV